MAVETGDLAAAELVERLDAALAKIAPGPAAADPENQSSTAAQMPAASVQQTDAPPTAAQAQPTAPQEEHGSVPQEEKAEDVERRA